MPAASVSVGLLACGWRSPPARIALSVFRISSVQVRFTNRQRNGRTSADRGRKEYVQVSRVFPRSSS